jgi:chromosome segregation ATPase
MKKKFFFLPLLACMAISFAACSQKYKSASDTVKLNKEWVNVSNDIAKLTSELTIAQNNLPGYHSKAVDAVSDAQTSAQKSSDQAYKATNGDLGDAKTAKKDAKKALNDAQDAGDAKDKAKDQEKKIDKLTSQLQKKQKQLAELEEMRTTIRAMHQ